MRKSIKVMGQMRMRALQSVSRLSHVGIKCQRPTVPSGVTDIGTHPHQVSHPPTKLCLRSNFDKPGTFFKYVSYDIVREDDNDDNVCKIIHADKSHSSDINLILETGGSAATFLTT